MSPVKSPIIASKGCVLITGCSSGIGYYCAVELQKSGYTVLASTRTQSDADKLIGQNILAHPLDLDDKASIEQGFKWATQQRAQPIIALFNNAGFGLVSAIEDMPYEALNAQFSTNVIGTQHLTNLYIQYLRRHKQGGRIIYNSSILGFVSIPFRGAYNASKYALEGFADSLRLELSRSPEIKIILIEPGPIESRFRENAILAFKKWIDPTTSFFTNYYAKQKAIYDQAELPKTAFTLGPEAVYHALIHALESKHPKLRYRVTVPTQLFWWLKRLLPTSWLDRLLTKI